MTAQKTIILTDTQFVTLESYSTLVLSSVNMKFHKQLSIQNALFLAADSVTY
jgi:hypothetical protein